VIKKKSSRMHQIKVRHKVNKATRKNHAYVQGVR